MRLLVCVIFSVLSVFGAKVWASETKNYKIDGSHSNVGFTARHMISRVNGEFTELDGQFTFNPEDLKSAKVTASVKAASINTKEKKRDEHLRSGDFFDVSKFPKLEFASKQITDVGGKKYKMTGDLTMHGQTKPVTFDVEYLGEAQDPWGGRRAGFTATAKVNRKDFGINWNKTLDQGGVLVGDEVEIQVNVEGLQTKSEDHSKKI
jgi:polyisoprenoid-binding protein YceI